MLDGVKVPRYEALSIWLGAQCDVVVTVTQIGLLVPLSVLPDVPMTDVCRGVAGSSTDGAGDLGLAQVLGSPSRARWPDCVVPLLPESTDALVEKSGGGAASAGAAATGMPTRSAIAASRHGLLRHAANRFLSWHVPPT